MAHPILCSHRYCCFLNGTLLRLWIVSIKAMWLCSGGQGLLSPWQLSCLHQRECSVRSLSRAQGWTGLLPGGSTSEPRQPALQRLWNKGANKKLCRKALSSFTSALQHITPTVVSFKSTKVPLYRRRCFACDEPFASHEVDCWRSFLRRSWAACRGELLLSLLNVIHKYQVAAVSLQVITLWMYLSRASVETHWSDT